MSNGKSCEGSEFFGGEGDFHFVVWLYGFMVGAVWLGYSSTFFAATIPSCRFIARRNRIVVEVIEQTEGR